MNLKICLISPLVYSLLHPDDKRILPFGGSEVQLYQLGGALARDKQFEVSFVVGDFGHWQPKEEVVKLPAGGEVKVYKVVNFYDIRPFFTVIADSARLFFAMKKARADIYLIRGGGLWVGLACLYAKLLGKKFIFSSAHDRESSGEFASSHNFVTGRLFGYGVRHADAVIAQHELQRQLFKKNYGIRSLLVRSMYEVGRREELKSLAARKDILWVGRLESWKRPEIFLKLAEDLPEETFVLVTNRDLGKLGRFGKLSANLQIKQDVPLAEMDGWFSKAKAFVNTSISEGFPNTFIQAAKNGTPIVSLTVDPDGMIGWFHIGHNAGDSPTELASYLKKLIGNPALWQEISLNCYNYANDYHNINNVMESYKKIFFDLCQTKKR